MCEQREGQWKAADILYPVRRFRTTDIGTAAGLAVYVAPTLPINLSHAPALKPSLMGIHPFEVPGNLCQVNPSTGAK